MLKLYNQKPLCPFLSALFPPLALVLGTLAPCDEVTIDNLSLEPSTRLAAQAKGDHLFSMDPDQILGTSVSGPTRDTFSSPSQSLWPEKKAEVTTV